VATRIGEDSDGTAVLAAATGDGVDSAWVGVSSSARTATYRAAFDHEGGLIIGIADMAVMDEVTPATVADAAAGAPAGDAFVVDANLPAPTLAFLVEAAGGARHEIAAVAVSPAKAVKLVPLLDRLTVLFATRREAAALLGRDHDPTVPTRELAAMLGQRGVANVIVTDSADPVAVAAGGEVHAFATFPVRVRSVNGAGDALAAGTLHGLAEGRPIFEAVLFGLAAAAITVEEDSTVAAGLSAAAVEERIAKARIVA
jgi:pseudouridine kinase